MRGPRPVTTLRKSTRLDEAYDLAREQMAGSDADDWDIADLGWCLIDLIKRHSSEPDSEAFQRYLRELRDLEVPPTNDVLCTQRERWLSLNDKAGREAERARQLGKQGKHGDAISIFAQLAENGQLRDADRPSFGWELCHAIQEIIRSGSGPKLAEAPIGKARRYLRDYFRLGLTGPDLLHSRIAQQALKLAKAGHIKIVPFAKMWDLDTFRREDHERFCTDGGKILPALSESFVNLVAKQAAANESLQDINFVLPQLEAISARFPDNPWLKMNRVKLLDRMDRGDDARALAVEFVRAKSREFWAWDLLGDLLQDAATKLACYAKALLCSNSDEFIGKVRLKFAESIAGEHPAAARAEVERVISTSQKAGYRIPPEAEELTHRGWYLSATPQAVGPSFYEKFTQPADDYLFAQLPKRLAVIDHVNHERKLFHFIVDRGIDAVAPFKSLGRTPKEGEIVKVRVDTIKGPEGPRTNLLSIEATDDLLPPHLGRQFQGEARVSNGMGFMSDGTFIPAPVIATARIRDGDMVSGIAVINYDRKKARWGFKALNALPETIT